MDALTKRQLTVLKYIHSHQPIAQVDLVQHFGFSKTRACQLVAELVGKGVALSAYKQARSVRLSAAGRRIFLIPIVGCVS